MEQSRFASCTLHNFWRFYAMQNRISSTMTTPRVRMHASCVRTREEFTMATGDCCQICGEEFIGGHDQLSELLPIDLAHIEATSIRLSNKINEREAIERDLKRKQKRTLKPNRRARKKTFSART